MALRFRKSIKLMPGVRLNVGKRGGSVSIGGKGATVNVNKKGVRTTLGIPGTGLSYSKYSSHTKKGASNSSSSSIGTWAFVIILLFVAVLTLAH